jgi:predicted amidohydrolase
MSGRVVVAAVQAEVARDLAGGLERTAELAGRAAMEGAELIVFPETWLPGYPAWLDVCRDAALWDHAPVKAVYRRMAEESVTIPGPAVERLGGIARLHEVTLAIGVVERVEKGPGRGTLFNALLLFGPDGSLLNHHRKLMPTYTERLVWGPGDARGVRAVDTPVGRVGGLICWEHWMPLARQALHESGEDIHVALWPTVKEINLVACRQYAFEGRCYVVAVGSLMRASALPPELEPHPAAVTDRAQWVLQGGSAVVAPDGSVIAGPVFEEERILFAELDLGRVREESMNLDVAGHYARPDCFRLLRLTPAGGDRGGETAGAPATSSLLEHPGGAQH